MSVVERMLQKYSSSKFNWIFFLLNEVPNRILDKMNRRKKITNKNRVHSLSFKNRDQFFPPVYLSKLMIYQLICHSDKTHSILAFYCVRFHARNLRRKTRKQFAFLLSIKFRIEKDTFRFDFFIFQKSF